jgi:hypothetical protein
MIGLGFEQQDADFINQWIGLRENLQESRKPHI